MELQRLARARHALVADVVKDARARDACGPKWAADDGILLAAGAMLAARTLCADLHASAAVAIGEAQAAAERRGGACASEVGFAGTLGVIG